MLNSLVLTSSHGFLADGQDIDFLIACQIMKGYGGTVSLSYWPHDFNAIEKKLFVSYLPRSFNVVKEKIQLPIFDAVGDSLLQVIGDVLEEAYYIK